MSSPYVKGLDKLRDKIKRLEKLPTAFGNEFVKRVQDKTPVDTGRLKAAWNLTVEDTAITVANDARNDKGEPYSAYVEYGTEHTHGAFMLARTEMEKEDILKTARTQVGL